VYPVLLRNWYDDCFQRPEAVPVYSSSMKTIREHAGQGPVRKTTKGGAAMVYACAAVAALALKLKRQYQALLGASDAYGRDKTLTQQIDALGLLIKELEDAVVVLQVQLEQDKDSAPMAEQG
jgi:hypothetical protein